ncbi:MAG TPA: MarR family transcriptional regulator [Flavobacteriaceae bacterium]|nr:MarR family transcriptional regulator [Flavobacteriaceae bacterium]
MNIEKSIKNSIPLSSESRTTVNILYTSRFIEDQSAPVYKEYGITAAHFNILRILRGQKGQPANLSTIQERMIDRSSNTTRLIDKLILKNWVTRQICPSNRRKIEVNITDLGLEKLLEIDRGVEQTLTRILSNLTEKEMGQLNTLLDKVRA